MKFLIVKPPNMKIYIFRHAQKSFLPSGDPGLTEFGKNQAEQLASWVHKKVLPLPNQILTSPKLRAQQTFQVLADTFRLPLEVHDHLVEQSHKETGSLFRERVQNFLQTSSSQCQSDIPLNSSEKILFLCTHHDWIAESLTLINCDTSLDESKYNAWPPCQFIGFHLIPNDPIWKLIDFRQIIPSP